MYKMILDRTPDRRSLSLDNAHLEYYLSKIRTDRVLVSLGPMEDKPSPAQLGYYFAGCVEAFADDKGMDPKAVHAYLELTCNPLQYVNPGTGEITIIAGTMSGKGKHAWSQYIDRCIMELAHQGFVVKTPQEYFKSIAQKKK